MVHGVNCPRTPFAHSSTVTKQYTLIGGRKMWHSYFPIRYKSGELTTLQAGNLHWAVSRPSLLELMDDEPFTQLSVHSVYPDTPDDGTMLLEDASFFARAEGKGVKIVTEPSLIVGHVDVKTGLCYFPDTAARIANGLEPPLYSEAHSKVPQKPNNDRRVHLASQGGDDVWQTNVWDGTPPDESDTPRGRKQTMTDLYEMVNSQHPLWPGGGVNRGEVK